MKKIYKRISLNGGYSYATIGTLKQANEFFENHLSFEFLRAYLDIETLNKALVAIGDGTQAELLLAYLAMAERNVVLHVRSAPRETSVCRQKQIDFARLRLANS